MPSVKWGPFELPPSAATEHFLFVGATGSGKTVLIKLLMRSSLSPLALSRASRAVVYDAKQDVVPFLADVAGGMDSLILMHPFDRRGYAWDIAKDVTSVLSARQVASILIPDRGKSSGADEFFNEASREILMAAMLTLAKSRPGAWTFRDVLLLALDLDQLASAIKATKIHTLHRIARTYIALADPKTKANILSSLSSKLGVYEPIAAAWSASPRRISVREWILSNQVLVLGNDEAARASLDPINRAIFQRITEEILSLPEQPREDADSGRGRTWVVLDEFREAGRLDGLRRLLNKGRSKGACVVLGCQDVDGVRAVYGKEEGNELLAQCRHTVVLNVGSPSTAEWGANLFGAQDVLIESEGESIGGGFSENLSAKIERKTVVSTRELVTMPRIGPNQGMSGYFKSPVLESSPTLRNTPVRDAIAPWRASSKPELQWSTIEPNLRSRDVPTFEASNASQFLEPWSDAERVQLGSGFEKVVVVATAAGDLSLTEFDDF